MYMTSQVFTSLDAKDFKSLLADTVKEAVKFEVDRIIAQPREPQKQFLTRKDVSEILGVSLVTLNDWSKSGIVPSYRLGTRVRYRYSDIQNALQKKGERMIA